MARKGRQQACSFERQITRTVGARYLLSLPEGYGEDAARRCPLLLFLHGIGERGEDLERIKRHGLPRVIERGDRLPFIVASPQCPPGEWWDVGTLVALLDEVEERYAVDPDRIYVTGLSMGGYGTWRLALAQPERFAAIAPICGGGNPAQAQRIKHLPV